MTSKARFENGGENTTWTRRIPGTIFPECSTKLSATTV